MITYNVYIGGETIASAIKNYEEAVESAWIKWNEQTYSGEAIVICAVDDTDLTTFSTSELHHHKPFYTVSWLNHNGSWTKIF